ncbi:MAG TPA: hypothetical protein VF960_08390 [Chloroflexota bacterium]
MDKEDCIQVLLSALQQPLWKSCDSVTDWDLKNVLWRAGLLLAPEQAAALFSDIKRRGLISGRERRYDDRIEALWAVRISQTGEEWMAQRSQAISRPRTPQPRPRDEFAELRVGGPDEPLDAPLLAEGDGGEVGDVQVEAGEQA